MTRAQHPEFLVEEPSMSFEATRAIVPHIEPARNRSHSFGLFRNALAEATA